jgi:phosphoribosyl-ATP pyrophosphohydrolase
MSQSVDRLYQAAVAAMSRDPAFSRTAKLFRDGIDKMVKKLAEEAVEVGIEAIRGKTQTVVQESADVMYQLCVLWAAMGIRPEDIWNEMDRRERLYGIAEKLPKGAEREAANESSSVNALQARLRNLG